MPYMPVPELKDGDVLEEMWAFLVAIVNDHSREVERLSVEVEMLCRERQPEGVE